MSFIFEFVGSLIEKSMEDPVKRREDRAAHLRKVQADAAVLKAKWASPVRAPDFWRTDANNAQLAFNLNPALPKMTGRREAYPSPQ